MHSLISKFYLVLVVSSNVLNRQFVSSSTIKMFPKFDYPQARRDETVFDEFHGVKVSDPYRFLEDPDSEETQQFVNHQNELTKPFLESGPEWNSLNTKLTSLWNYQKFGCVSKHGDKYFFSMNTGLQNQK